MNPYLQDPDVTLYHGDALAVLRELPDESVHCIATSPPFYALRDYGTGRWEGGGEGCDHVPDTRQGSDKQDDERRERGERQGYSPRSNFANAGKSQTASDALYRDTCGKCGARRIDQQIGLEETPDAWAAALVAVFREARRVLRKDGTLWVECGDSYTSIGRSPRKPPPGVGAKQEMGRVERDVIWAPRDEGDPNAHFSWSLPGKQKPKDLLGAPFMLAFGLRDDGWWWRSTNIWHKPNCLPESVTDRPVVSHSYVFQFSKKARYFHDAEAVREPAEMKPQQRLTVRADHPKGDEGRPAHRRPEGGGGTIPAPQIETLDVAPAITATPDKNGASGGGNEPAREPPSFTERGLRSVWQIPTQGYPEAHFATWPMKLAERILLMACPEGGCVLDPFVGSGTTCHVARKLGRRSVGIDLSSDYLDLAARRLQQQSLFAEPAA